jgi:hypothetical protein
MPNFAIDYGSLPDAMENETMDCYGPIEKGFFLFKQISISEDQCYTIWYSKAFRILVIMIFWSMYTKFFH